MNVSTPSRRTYHDTPMIVFNPFRFAAGGSTPPQPQAPPNLMRGLVSWWGMDETSTRYDDHSRYDLSRTGSPTTTAGVVDNATLLADGQRLFRDPRNTPLTGAGGSWTIMSFVRPDQVGQRTWNMIGAEWAGNQCWYAGIAQDTMTWKYRHSGGMMQTAFSTPVAGEWTCIYWGYDADAGEAFFGVMGEGEMREPATPMLYTGSVFELGSYNNNSSGFGWVGAIDNTAYWRRVLSAEEREMFYNGGMGVSFWSLPPPPADPMILQPVGLTPTQRMWSPKFYAPDDIYRPYAAGLTHMLQRPGEISTDCAAKWQVQTGADGKPYVDIYSGYNANDGSGPRVDWPMLLEGEVLIEAGYGRRTNVFLNGGGGDSVRISVLYGSNYTGWTLQTYQQNVTFPYTEGLTPEPFIRHRLFAEGDTYRQQAKIWSREDAEPVDWMVDRLITRADLIAPSHIGIREGYGTRNLNFYGASFDSDPYGQAPPIQR